MHNPKPRYQQLKDSIIARISSGDLLPSDRVPSENELVETMNVSRMTANRALRELNDEGYVERIAGRGTFVSDYRSRSHLLEVHNIADEIERRGNVHSSLVLRQRLEPTDSPGLDPDDRKLDELDIPKDLEQQDQDERGA